MFFHTQAHVTGTADPSETRRNRNKPRVTKQNVKADTRTLSLWYCAKPIVQKHVIIFSKPVINWAVYPNYAAYNLLNFDLHNILLVSLLGPVPCMRLLRYYEYFYNSLFTFKLPSISLRELFIDPKVPTLILTDRYTLFLYSYSHWTLLQEMSGILADWRYQI